MSILCVFGALWWGSAGWCTDWLNEPAAESTNLSDKKSSGTVASIDAYGESEQTADQLSLSADYALRNGHYDKAISFCKRALSKDATDLDIHKAYAESLEAKLKAEKNSDSDIFNACLQEWLVVMRSETGPEKLPNWHGITVPGYGHLYTDEDHEMEARNHIRALTGSTPKLWETDVIFIKRAGKQTTASVSGKLVKSDDSSKSSGPKPLHLPPALKISPPADPLDWMNQ